MNKNEVIGATAYIQYCYVLVVWLEILCVKKEVETAFWLLHELNFIIVYLNTLHLHPLQEYLPHKILVNLLGNSWDCQDPQHLGCIKCLSILLEQVLNCKSNFLDDNVIDIRELILLLASNGTYKWQIWVLYLWSIIQSQLVFLKVEHRLSSDSWNIGCYF